MEAKAPPMTSFPMLVPAFNTFEYCNYYRESFNTRTESQKNGLQALVRNNSQATVYGVQSFETSLPIPSTQTFQAT